ncbi:hypothetical protein AB5I41_22245 [Sphingomonas sp. MMS24-JH45]
MTRLKRPSIGLVGADRRHPAAHHHHRIRRQHVAVRARQPLCGAGRRGEPAGRASRHQPPSSPSAPSRSGPAWRRSSAPIATSSSGVPPYRRPPPVAPTLDAMRQQVIAGNLAVGADLRLQLVSPGRS